MRRYAVQLCLPVALLLLLCCCVDAFATHNQSPGAVSPTHHREERVLAFADEKQIKGVDDKSVGSQSPQTIPSFFANGKEKITNDVAVPPRPRTAQQFEQTAAAATDAAEVMQPASEAAKELPADRALSDSVNTTTTTTTTTTVSPTKTLTAAEKYGSILSGGVIASVTIVLIFACFLLVLVVIEMATNISDFVEHRRMVAYRKSKNGDDPCEPKYGDFRDTAVNLHV